MKGSTTSSSGPGRGRAAWWAALLWLAVWQAAAAVVGNPIILASPLEVARTFAALASAWDFYKTVAFSLSRIAAGFFLSAAAAALLAAASYRFRGFERLLEPLMRTIKSVPVASFIILVLVWVPSRNLSVAISFLVVLPIVYSNCLEGLRQTGRELLEMASVFRVGAAARIRRIYAPQVFPYFKAACSVGLGFAWKSGVAAEVIGLPLGSMGESLYQAKIFLDTPALLAWTVAIVLASLLFEKAVLLALGWAQRRVER